MPSEKLIKYNFDYSDGSSSSYEIKLDENLAIIESQQENSEWTKLENNKCSHCPLNAAQSPYCPIAKNLNKIVDNFSDKLSYHEAKVRVDTEERIYAKKVPIQDGLFSIFGLVMATAGCPHLDFLKPMANFHLPFANSQETIVRSVSMYLLGQYFLYKEGKRADFDLEQLEELYEKINTVNLGILSRIRSFAEGDADANAVTILHNFAQLLGLAISNDLSAIKPLFKNAPERK